MLLFYIFLSIAVAEVKTKQRKYRDKGITKLLFLICLFLPTQAVGTSATWVYILFPPIKGTVALKSSCRGKPLLQAFPSFSPQAKNSPLVERFNARGFRCLRAATKGSAFGIRKPLKRLDLNFTPYVLLLCVYYN